MSTADRKATRAAWRAALDAHYPGRLTARYWWAFTWAAARTGDVRYVREGLGMLCETLMPQPVFRAYCRVSRRCGRVRSWLAARVIMGYSTLVYWWLYVRLYYHFHPELRPLLWLAVAWPALWWLLHLAR